jgi:hypothetical protein
MERVKKTRDAAIEREDDRLAEVITSDTLLLTLRNLIAEA